MESRVVPASGLVSSRSSPSRWLISVDLPALGRPTMATRIGRCASLLLGTMTSSSLELFVVLDRLRHQRAQRVVEIAHALAMLGGNLDGSPRPERVGFHRADFAVLALGSCWRPAPPACWRVRAKSAKARSFGVRPMRGVDHEHQGVGELDRGFGLLLHPRRQRALGALVEAGGVDDGEFEIARACLALAAVAGDAGLVIDQRELLPDQPVEQRRLSDIGPADDGNRKRHRIDPNAALQRRVSIDERGNRMAARRNCRSAAAARESAAELLLRGLRRLAPCCGGAC